MVVLSIEKPASPPSVGPGTPLRIGNWANAITMARTAIAVPTGVGAVANRSLGLLVAAYAVYWIGDVLDGWIARKLNCETRFGAVFDIVCDRACSGVLVCAFAAISPRLWLPLAVFLLQFMAVDTMLSLAFLRWPILSPNYFHQVDARVWRVNWSPPAKAANTAAVALAALAGSWSLALAIAVAQLAVKVWSAREVLGLAEGRPQPAASS